MHQSGDGSQAIFHNTTLSNNTAVNFGGALAQQIGCVANFTHSNFVSNIVKDGDGGSIWSDGCDLNLFSCNFQGTYAKRHGGGICSTGLGLLDMQESYVFNATAEGDGAAIYRASYAARDDILGLVRTTFLDCRASGGSGGAIFVSGRINVAALNSSFVYVSMGH